MNVNEMEFHAGKQKVMKKTKNARLQSDACKNAVKLARRALMAELSILPIKSSKNKNICGLI